MKKFILAIALAFFSFSMHSMELDKEIGSVFLEQETLMLTLQKFLDSEDNEAFIEDLNIFANALLYQDKLMNILRKYVDASENKFNLENSLSLLITENFLSKDFENQEPVLCSRAVSSPEALSLILQYPKIFQELILDSKDALIEDGQCIIKKLLSFPEIDELCQTWKKSSDSDINFFGTFISLHINNTRQAKIKSTELKKFLILSKEYFSMKGKYFFIQDYIKSTEEDVVLNCLSFFKPVVENIEKFHVEFCNIVADKKNSCANLDKNFIVKSSLLVEEYEKKRLDFISCYEQVIKKLHNLIDSIKDRKKKAQFVRYKKRAISSSVSLLNPIAMPNGKNECAYKINFTFEDLLPKTFVECDQNTIEDQTIKSEDNKFDFLSDLVKNFESNKNKQTQKNRRQQKHRGQQKHREQQKNSDIVSKKETLLVGINAEDESSILEEAGDYVLIKDPKNNLESKILKSVEGSRVTLSEQDLQNIKTTDWVNAWYSNPDKALVDQGYTVVGRKYVESDLGRSRVKAIHSPAQVIWQNLILKWAKQSERSSRRVKDQRDILLTLPGVNYYHNDNSIQMGVFSYLIDSATKQMYHVNFEPREGKKLMNDYLEKGYFEVEFPSLNDVYQ